MAWDMVLLRLLEQAATATQNGSFFIPYFVTNDGRWRELLRLSPVKMMVIDDRDHRVQVARQNEKEFRAIFIECLQGELRSCMTPETIEKRRLAAKNLQGTRRARRGTVGHPIVCIICAPFIPYR
ncbi:hypothetical protein KAC00_004724 [Salmonella enterica]|nr:hypothetical protein [Salmonella enterica subsp. enterica]EHJ0380027.1 hypothetical protein [Salmonella enterica]EHJ0380377.1 hypothetical protein [Salmonella enterica]